MKRRKGELVLLVTASSSSKAICTHEFKSYLTNCSDFRCVIYRQLRSSSSATVPQIIRRPGKPGARRGTLDLMHAQHDERALHDPRRVYHTQFTPIHSYVHRFQPSTHVARESWRPTFLQVQWERCGRLPCTDNASIYETGLICRLQFI